MSVDELLAALPVRDVRAEGILADFAPSTTDDVPIVAEVEIAEERFTELAAGIRAALHHYFGAEGGIAVVVRQLETGAEAGQKVVENLYRLITALRYVEPVPAAADLISALPIRGIKVRAGTAGNCGGIVVAVVDLEPHEGFELELGAAELPESAEDFPDLIAQWAEDFASGLRVAFGGPPPVRVVLRKLAGSYADANSGPWRQAGRLVVAEAVRRAAG